jgi:hypothetical protein
LVVFCGVLRGLVRELLLYTASAIIKKTMIGQHCALTAASFARALIETLPAEWFGPPAAITTCRHE